MTAYYIHVGPSLSPRRHGQPLTLAEAIHRAYRHRYAVVYRLLGDKPVPIVAAAGDDEIVFVPTGRRVPRDAVAWCTIHTDEALWLTMLRSP